jgi:hypothetical protein
MDLEAVKETLDYHNTLALANGAMKIEKDPRLAETDRKPIPWLSLTQASSSVGHQNSILIVNRYHDPTLHAAPARKEAHPEVPGCFRADPALREVGVVEVDADKGEGKGPVRFFVAR